MLRSLPLPIRRRCSCRLHRSRRRPGFEWTRDVMPVCGLGAILLSPTPSAGPGNLPGPRFAGTFGRAAETAWAATDITSLPQAWLRDGFEDLSCDLLANSDADGGIVVTFPLDAPTGRQTLNFRYELEIPTVACEGFSSCALTGQHFEQAFMTAQDAG